MQCFIRVHLCDHHRIPDPDATKPEDWDEDAPRVIPDEDAVKPAGWLDDEPSEVPDACTVLQGVCCTFFAI